MYFIKDIVVENFFITFTRKRPIRKFPKLKSVPDFGIVFKKKKEKRGHCAYFLRNDKNVPRNGKIWQMQLLTNTR